MSAGLLALLDDIAALVKMTAASLDDVSAQVAKTTSKVTGVVIDDAAVTPKYVVGLDPARELAIIWKIARASMLNKLIFLTPAALVLGFLAPWAITPILMIGGGYLCFEGYEKVHAMFLHAQDGDHAHGDIENMEKISPEDLEKERVSSAVRTDFILSAEIMAIAYATVATKPIGTQIAVLLAIAIGMTALVYGFVGGVVKADDIGLHFAKKGRTSIGRAMGRRLVTAMPAFLVGLGRVGTAAMLWVGAGIIAHGIGPVEHGIHSVAHVAQMVPGGSAILTILILIVLGLAVGFVIAKAVGAIKKALGRPAHG